MNLITRNINLSFNRCRIKGKTKLPAMSTSYKVYVTRRIPYTALNLLQERCSTSVWDSNDPVPRDVLIKNVPGIDALYCLLTDKINKEVLDAAGPNLKVIGTMSVGYSHIDLQECKKRSIQVGYTPDVLTDTTAELGVALLLACSRRLLEAAQEVRNGGWSTWSPLWMCGTNLAESTVGIVGLGRIGLAIIERLRGFKVKQFFYTGPNIKSKDDSLGAQYLSLPELLQCSDFVIACCALTPETKELFNRDAFSLMKNTAIFINISRGEVVDQDALYEALANKVIKAAGLDVTSPEPLPTDHPLLTLKNCVILPHIGSATEATRFRMAELTSENILTALEGKLMPAEIKF